VSVFAALAEITQEELKAEMTGAESGLVTVDQWLEWMKRRKPGVQKLQGCPTDLVNCAHLVSEHHPRGLDDFHWIYRDKEGDVHDPSPSYMYMPADDERMRCLQQYRHQELTIWVG